MAHGDIKQENILVKVAANDEDEIVDIALSDFDTLCIGTRNILTGMYQCEATANTVMYTTNELQQKYKTDVPFDIRIKQKSDIYAISMVILMLWYGYVGFLSHFGDMNKEFFIGNFQDLSKNTPKANRRRSDVFELIRVTHERKFEGLYVKYASVKHMGDLINTYTLVTDTINTLENIMKDIPGQSGGGSRLYNYKYEYLKCKQRYLQMKRLL